MMAKPVREKSLTIGLKRAGEPCFGPLSHALRTGLDRRCAQAIRDLCVTPETGETARNLDGFCRKRSAMQRVALEIIM
jgi:hypothetical protein